MLGYDLKEYSVATVFQFTQTNMVLLHLLVEQFVQLAGVLTTTFVALLISTAPTINRLLSSSFSESAPPVRLTVKEATSSPLAENSDLRNAYDFDMSSVMKTKDQEEGWAMFHVKKSAIRLARVANITDG